MEESKKYGLCPYCEHKIEDGDWENDFECDQSFIEMNGVFYIICKKCKKILGCYVDS